MLYIIVATITVLTTVVLLTFSDQIRADAFNITVIVYRVTYLGHMLLSSLKVYAAKQ